MVFGKKESYRLNEIRDEKDGTIFEHVQRVDHIIESAQAIRKEGNEGFSKSREMQHVARIPHMTFLANAHIFAPGGQVDEKALLNWLNTDEGRPYRVTEHRV